MVVGVWRFCILLVSCLTLTQPAFADQEGWEECKGEEYCCPIYEDYPVSIRVGDWMACVPDIDHEDVPEVLP